MNIHEEKKSFYENNKFRIRKEMKIIVLKWL